MKGTVRDTIAPSARVIAWESGQFGGRNPAAGMEDCRARSRNRGLTRLQDSGNPGTRIPNRETEMGSADRRGQAACELRLAALRPDGVEARLGLGRVLVETGKRRSRAARLVNLLDIRREGAIVRAGHAGSVIAIGSVILQRLQPDSRPRVTPLSLGTKSEDRSLK